MSKPKEVLELEKIYGITLNEIALSENFWESENRNCYQLNSRVEIIRLNLSSNQLSEIKGLEKLTQLHELDLSHNRISEIKGLEKLTQLHGLYLSSNQITEIKGLEKLTQLQVFDLYYNQIIEIKGLEQLTQLQGLYLSSNQITEIKGLEKLTQLHELSLSSNQITKIKGLEKLFQLKELNLSYNQITEIKGLEKLTQLQKLVLFTNKITEIKGLEKLFQLQELNLSYNQITEIKGLEQLTQLQKLNLSDNQLTEIKGLEKLTQLQELVLSGRSISDIIEVTHFTQLQEPKLSTNQITEIKGLEKLSHLQKLDLSGNQLTEIKGLEQLTQLQELDLSINQITEIKGLEKLTQLKKLQLAINQLTEIKGLEQLAQLQILYLLGNQVSEIKGLEQLTQLQVLKIHGNQLTEIKKLEKTLRQKSFMYLLIYANPFLQQESLILKAENNKEDILKYFSDNNKQQIKKNITLPVKIMLLGNHASGKTTFLQYLLQGTLLKKKIKSTHILRVHSYPVNQPNNQLLPKAVIYDFGGQDYYHGVYRAFFSENSITLLLWCIDSNKNDVRKAQDDLDCHTCDFTWNYWLFQLDKAINRYKEDKKKEPLFLVQTHADMPNNKECIYSDILHNLVNFEIKGKYFITLLKEAAEKINNKKFIQRLKDDLLDIVQEKTTPQERPAYYEEFLHYVLNFGGEEYVRVKEDILDKGHYKRKLIHNETSDDLLKYLKADLNQLYLKGLVLYYRDSTIDDIVWLNFSKTIDYIYKCILPKNFITKYKGKIPENDFNNLWKSKTKESEEIKKVRFGKIKELLINEKIVFLDYGKKIYIIPSFLPLSSEDKLHRTLSRDFDGQTPSFILKFRNFIPFGLINELICLYGNSPDDKHYWRNQLIFWFDRRHNVWIKFNFSQLSIEVYIRENNNMVSELTLKEVRKIIFSNIIDLYQGDYPKQRTGGEQIKYPKDMYISVANGIYVNPVDFDKNAEMLPAYELIDSGETTREKEKIEILEKEATTTSEIKLYKDFNNKSVTRMKKIFISYSKEDKTEMHEFLKHTVTLQEQGLIAKPWTDEWITLGKEWDDEIKRHIEECDIMICLISVDFLNTDYIRKVELKEAMKQDKILVPIIIKPCDWENCDFAKYQVALKGKCISLNENQKYTIQENTEVEKAKFWVEIIKEMRRKIFNNVK